VSTRSLRGRLTAAVGGLVAVALIGLAVALYLVVSRAAWQAHDRDLLGRARAVAALVEHDVEDGYEMELPEPGPSTTAEYFEVRLPDGGVLGRSAGLGARDLPGDAAGLDQPVFRDVELPDGQPGRSVALRFRPRDESGAVPEPVTLVLAGSTEDVRAMVGGLRTWFLIIGGLTLLLVAVATAWVVARGLRPLDTVAGDIAAIDDQRLATRLDVDRLPAELSIPVAKLNQLLERLETSFARERRFTADVSHELRTPLAGLRTVLEVATLKERSGDDYRAAIGEALDIAAQLAALVDNLLVLARIDSGQVAVASADITLRELVEDCWRPHAGRAAARGLVFDNRIDAAVRVQSDRDKLRLVVGNLLGNAADYTEAGGRIEVTAGDPDAVVDVIDSGPPIPDQHLERIFDRLWRADPARTGAHVGIGLSLARSVCGVLGMTVAAANLADGRVRFRVARA